MPFPLNTAREGVELGLVEVLAACFGQLIQKHKAHVVTRELILGAWIAQANNQVHKRLETHQRGKCEVFRRSQLDAFWEGEVIDVCGLIDLQVADVHRQGFRQFVRRTLDEQ